MVDNITPTDQITHIINGITDDSADSPTDPQVLLVYNELKKVARFHLRGQHALKTLTPTVLVNEAYLKMYANKDNTWKSRKHFYATASKAIKHIIIDAARKKQSDKRSALAETDLDMEQIQHIQFSAQLHDALKDLEQHDQFLYAVVELKFFIGLTSAEAGEVLERSRITVERAWKKAKNYLLQYHQE